MHQKVCTIFQPKLFAPQLYQGKSTHSAQNPIGPNC